MSKSDPNKKLLKIFNGLTDKEKESLFKRFSVNSLDELMKIDLDKIGKDFKVTRQKIQEIEAKALKSLKKGRADFPDNEPPDEVA